MVCINSQCSWMRNILQKASNDFCLKIKFPVLVVLLKPLRPKSSCRYSCEIPIKPEKEGMPSSSTFNEYQCNFAWETDAKNTANDFWYRDSLLFFSICKMQKTTTPVWQGLVVYSFVTWFDWGRRFFENWVSSNEYSDNIVTTEIVVVSIKWCCCYWHLAHDRQFLPRRERLCWRSTQLVDCRNWAISVCPSHRCPLRDTNAFSVQLLMVSPFPPKKGGGLEQNRNSKMTTNHHSFSLRSTRSSIRC